MSRDDTLIGEIRRDLLDGKPTADLLRKCLLLGSEAGSEELTTWARLELRGYGADDDLPSYRTITAVMKLDAAVGNGFVRGQTISPSELPEFAREVITNDVPLTMPIGEIEALASGGDADDHVKLQHPGAPDVVRMMNHESTRPFQQITDLYWSVAPSAIRGVVDNVRTTLTELAGELLRAMPTGQVSPTPEQANQAVQVAVHGRKSQVSVNTAQASGGSTSSVVQPAPGEPTDPVWWRTWSKLGGFIVGCAVILGTVIAVLVYLYG